MADIHSIGGNPIVPESVAANSVTDAMLAQTGGVLSAVDAIIDAINDGEVIESSSAYAAGGYNFNTGEVSTATDNRAAATGNPYVCLYGDLIDVHVADGLKAAILLYDESKQYVGYTLNVASDDSILQNRSGCFIRQLLRKSDNTDFTSEEMAALGESSFSIVSKFPEIAMERASSTVNIFDPYNFVQNGYYLDFTDGKTHVTGNQKMTTRPIVVNQDHIFVIQTYSTTATYNFCVYCYDESGAYLGYKVGSYAGLGAKFRMKLFDSTYSIMVMSNANALVSGSQICLTLMYVDNFVAYVPSYKVKNDALPLYQMLHYPRLKFKQIANFGDSVFGNKRPPIDVSTYLANLTGATVYNLGFGGCRMSEHSANWDAFSMYQLADAIATKDFTVQDAVDVDNVSGMPSYFKETRTLLESIDFSTVDVITIAYGTNDFTAGVALDNQSDPDDTTTFCGALRYSLDKIMDAYPQAHIFVCTPTWRFWIEGGEFAYDSDTHEISGQLLTAFVAAAKDVSEEYHVNCIDNYELGINKLNRSHWFPSNDGTHHNKYGAELIAQHMASEMF